MKNIEQKVDVLLEALPYFQKFKGSYLMIKLGGSLINNLEKNEFIDVILKDIILLECIGIKVIIVHGGGKEIERNLKNSNIPIKKKMGLRYTTKETLEIVQETLEKINTLLVEKVKKLSGQAISIKGQAILLAKKKMLNGSDLGFVGEVSKVEINDIKKACDNNIIPIITPLGIDKNQQIYNINADESTNAIAQALKVLKLIFFSDVKGILQDINNKNSIISTIKYSEINSLIDKGIIKDGMIPKVQNAVASLKSGVKKVHIIDAYLKHSLIFELFTDQGIGTEIINE